MTITDSKYVINGLCFHLKHWEDSGWVGVSNSEIWKATVAALCQQTAPVYFQWVKGHSGDLENEGADELAGMGAQLGEDKVMMAETEIDHKFNVDGSQAYQLLQMASKVEMRNTTKNMVSQVTAIIKEVNGVEPTPITFKIGTFWKQLGLQYSNRGICPHCKVTESMEHIILDCNIEAKGKEWIVPLYGLVLGSTLVQVKSSEGKVDRAATCLYQILMTETIHLIWKIHCQQCIQHGDENPENWHTETKVWNLWVNAMNKRLRIDCVLTLVLSTWRGTLRNKKSLPEDWMNHHGVLVGIVS
ncbi:hypothetical protein EDD18DRAFT_1311182 [Armillaria luteobubalina]|uniref:RNase H type-1 domain-containing protein n=1 Tax=Armillaria luteobubalina TaxID=153913 RepID=A0AA39PSQ2_9AGAR|nr:hypothetical protein EDD18DRAFT_1311182 [Armillaria luteobubalina]